MLRGLGEKKSSKKNISELKTLTAVKSEFKVFGKPSSFRVILIIWIKSFKILTVF